MSSIRVLHIDDEPDILDIASASLGLDPEFEVRDCGSGADGLVAAAEWHPDVILLDVMMPVMDGPATLAHLRENPRTADIPVVFMTARVQTQESRAFQVTRRCGRDHQTVRSDDARGLRAQSNAADRCGMLKPFELGL